MWSAVGRAARCDAEPTVACEVECEDGERQMEVQGYAVVYGSLHPLTITAQKVAQALL